MRFYELITEEDWGIELILEVEKKHKIISHTDVVCVHLSVASFTVLIDPDW